MLFCMLTLVSRSTADAPVQITNKQGMIVLATHGLEDVGAYIQVVVSWRDADLASEHPLASGFDILLGRYEITVPDVADADDYAIVREYQQFSNALR